jgi:hypothetical protein
MRGYCRRQCVKGRQRPIRRLCTIREDDKRREDLGGIALIRLDVDDEPAQNLPD